jgi:hypothetical protein
MLNTVQRNIQPLLFIYYAILSSQSGERVPDSYIRGLLSQQKYKKQNCYNPESGYSHELTLIPLLSAQKQEIPSDRAFSYCIEDAIIRYKRVNHTDNCDITQAETFLAILESFSTIFIPRISFYSDAVKAKLTFNQREFIIDYDYEEQNSVFISTFEGDKLIVKDAHITEIYTTLESF